MNRLTNGWTEFLEKIYNSGISFSKALAVMCKDLKQGSSGAPSFPEWPPLRSLPGVRTWQNFEWLWFACWMAEILLQVNVPSKLHKIFKVSGFFQSAQDFWAEMHIFQLLLIFLGSLKFSKPLKLFAASREKFLPNLFGESGFFKFPRF